MDESEGNSTEVEADADAKTGDNPMGDGDEGSLWLWHLEAALAAGYMLKTKAAGWKLFCERMSIPPFVLWECLPGFHRLERSLKLADEVGFLTEGIGTWLNRIRPEGEAEATEANILTAEKAAVGIERAFREVARWLGA